MNEKIAGKAKAASSMLNVDAATAVTASLAHG